MAHPFSAHVTDLSWRWVRDVLAVAGEWAFCLLAFFLSTLPLPCCLSSTRIVLVLALEKNETAEFPQAAAASDYSREFQECAGLANKLDSPSAA